MSWHIEVVYTPGGRKTVFSYGYPTKRSAEQARSRLVNQAKGTNIKYTVEESS